MVGELIAAAVAQLAHQFGGAVADGHGHGSVHCGFHILGDVQRRLVDRVGFGRQSEINYGFGEVDILGVYFIRRGMLLPLLSTRFMAFSFAKIGRAHV